MIVAGGAKMIKLPAYIGLPLVSLLVLDFAIALAYVVGGWTWLALPDVPLSIFGGIIGVIAGFRNTSSYARWWEARTIWGAVVNSSRSFARQVLTMIGADESGPQPQRERQEIKRKLVLLQIAYVHALRNHLRGIAPWPELSDLLPDTEIATLRTRNNVPLAIQEMIAALIAECYQRAWIDEVVWVNLDRTLSTLMNSQGASERIKNTPMPLLYDTFIRLAVNVYCILLPLGMVANLGLWTPLGSALVGFMFLAIDKIGRDLEMPFENLPHDIPLSAITRTIEIDLKQMVGETAVPTPAVAVEDILW